MNMNELWDLSNLSVIILGAGFSAAATDGRMPLMGNFFVDIDQNQFQLLTNYIQDIEGDIQKANVEVILMTLEQMRTTPDTVLDNLGSKWKKSYKEIHNELTRYILSRFKNAIQIKKKNWAVNLLAQVGEKTTVISMNYDNIAERILSNRKEIRSHTRGSNCPHCKMRSILEKTCNCDERTSITREDWQGAILKPHGSISWRRCINSDCCNYECLVADKHCRPYEACICPSCGEKCVPAIVLPSVTKNLEKIPEISAMWNASYDAISEAESIMIFGFSFPLSDALYQHLIKKGICSQKKLKKIGIIDLDPKSVSDRISKCIPDDCQVNGTYFPVIPNQKPDWLIYKDCP